MAADAAAIAIAATSKTLYCGRNCDCGSQFKFKYLYTCCVSNELKEMYGKFIVINCVCDHSCGYATNFDFVVKKW